MPKTDDKPEDETPPEPKHAAVFKTDAEWAKAPRKKDEYFVDIAHLNAVHEE